MRPAYSIGIDLGGTNIKAVAVTHQGEVLGQDSGITQQMPGSVGCWVDEIREMIATFESNQQQAAAHIGMATPGIIAVGSRSVAWCPGKLVGIEGFDWTVALGRQEAVPLLNDAHAALL